ncbi:hypothetical protein RZS08_19865, partial [Arthrospira platensis SPKY1]|nr:hypothetical protein [Arthrospira platensis SPKY1]
IDITGETHTGEVTISLGYIALQASISLPEQMSLEDFTSIPISTQNLQGQFEPAKGTLRLDQLQDPGRLLVKRYWNAPDRYLIPEAEFRKDFPQYAWKGEDQVENWPVKRPVFEVPFNTAEQTAVPAGKGRLEPGVYLLTLKTADKY